MGGTLCVVGLSDDRLSRRNRGGPLVTHCLTGFATGVKVLYLFRNIIKAEATCSSRASRGDRGGKAGQSGDVRSASIVTSRYGLHNSRSLIQLRPRGRLWGRLRGCPQAGLRLAPAAKARSRLPRFRHSDRHVFVFRAWMGHEPMRCGLGVIISSPTSLSHQRPWDPSVMLA